MIPVLIQETGEWLDHFSLLLNRWEKMLADLQVAYINGDHQSILIHCEIGEKVQAEIAASKHSRDELIRRAASMGCSARSIRELSIDLDANWPAIWTHRIANLELQLYRVRQLSASMWVAAHQSRLFVSEMLMILATGKSEVATYAPGENSAHEGGYLVNEAA